MLPVNWNTRQHLDELEHGLENQRLTINAVYSELLHEGQRGLGESLPRSMVSGYLSKGLTALASTADGEHDPELRVLFLQQCE